MFMKSMLIVCAIVLSMSGIAQPQKTNSQKPAAISSPIARTSYGFGVLVASNLRAQAGDSLDLEAFFKGIRDSYNNQPLQITPQECEGLVQQHVQRFNTRKTEKLKKEGVEFLAHNKNEAGVTTTASGLQYKVINRGEGKIPTAADRATVHYTGKLIDGTIFDSSVQRGQPATFEVTRVIKGWVEALQLMHEGDKWILYIPQELAYGATGSGKIPPYSALIFEVELIKVN